MKDWLSIGEFSKQVGVSTRTLLASDDSMNTATLTTLLRARRDVIEADQETLARQSGEIERILERLANAAVETSPNANTVALMPRERRFIMSHFEKISIVVTGTTGLDTTARLIQKQLAESGTNVDVLFWPTSKNPITKPYILIVPEEHLADEKITALTPDVVVIKNLSGSKTTRKNIFKPLCRGGAPHDHSLQRRRPALHPASG